ncbi:MAG TPA: hypothetical protein VHX60_04910 [Acidobacteriaceae bacterium]|nr:hypothetical protein [Acidobacteriaceae bacterium]
MIERVRKLRDAAEKKMNVFGDPAGYDVRIIRDRKSGLEALAAEGKTNEV